MYVSEANESAKAKSANVTHMSKVKNAHEKWSAVIFYGLAQSCRRHVKGKDTLSMEGQERMTARNRLYASTNIYPMLNLVLKFSNGLDCSSIFRNNMKNDCPGDK